MILAADDVADAQIRVVGTRCHVIGGQCVAAEQREILNVGGGFRLFSVDQILEHHCIARLARHTIAHHEGFAGRRTTIAFFPRHRAHFGMKQPVALGMRFLFRVHRQGCEIPVREPFCENLIRQLPVQIQPLGLPVKFIPGQILQP